MIFKHHTPTHTAEADLAAHHDQECELVRELDDSERDPEVGPMFRVRFADGYEDDLHADELHPAPPSRFPPSHYSK